MYQLNFVAVSATNERYQRQIRDVSKLCVIDRFVAWAMTDKRTDYIRLHLPGWIRVSPEYPGWMVWLDGDNDTRVHSATTVQLSERLHQLRLGAHLKELAGATVEPRPAVVCSHDQLLARTGVLTRQTIDQQGNIIQAAPFVDDEQLRLHLYARSWLLSFGRSFDRKNKRVVYLPDFEEKTAAGNTS